MNEENRRRFGWIRLYEETSDAGFVCRRCGISRSTLRKCWGWFQEAGEACLVERSRRPKRSAKRKIFRQQRALILRLRARGDLGARRIQSELRLHRETELSITTIQKVLDHAQVKPLRELCRIAHAKRYNRPSPGDRIRWIR